MHYKLRYTVGECVNDCGDVQVLGSVLAYEYDFVAAYAPIGIIPEKYSIDNGLFFSMQDEDIHCLSGPIVQSGCPLISEYEIPSSWSIDKNWDTIFSDYNTCFFVRIVIYLEIPPHADVKRCEFEQRICNIIG